MTRPDFAQAVSRRNGSAAALGDVSTSALPTSISGVVTLGDDPFPVLEGVNVFAFRRDSTTGDYLDTTTTVTDVNGEYLLLAAGGGDFMIHFDDPQRRGASMVYDQHSFYGVPDPVTIADGGSLGGIDASLPLPGTVSGTVSAPGRNLSQLAEHISIYVLHNEPSLGWVDTGWYWEVSPTGAWEIDDLAPGEYQFVAEYRGPQGVALDFSPVLEYSFSDVGDSHGWNPLLLLFSDVAPGQAFADEIAWLAGTGVSTGYPDGTFKPWNPVARDAMAAFLYRFAGEPPFDPPAVSPFTDVPLSYPFYDEVTWLASTGITTGYPDGTFRPSNPVGRDAMAAFLYRFAGEPTFDPPGVSPFTDVPLSYSFYDEITWLASTGVTTGYPDGTFRPWNPVNRDAMAAFLFRFANLP